MLTHACNPFICPATDKESATTRDIAASYYLLKQQQAFQLCICRSAFLFHEPLTGQ